MAGRAGRGNTGLVGAMAAFFLELDHPRWTTVQVSHETDLVLGQSRPSRNEVSSISECVVGITGLVYEGKPSSIERPSIAPVICPTHSLPYRFRPWHDSLA